MDHCKREYRKKHPRENANIFSLLTFTYALGLMKKAFKKDLEEEDLYEVLKNCSSQRCGTKLENHWLIEKARTEKKDKPMSVRRMMWNRWGKKYLLIGFVDFCYSTINSIVQPYALSHLIAYFAPGQTTITKNDAYFYAALVLTQSIVKVFYFHNYIMWVTTFGMEIRTAFSSLLYRKALKLTPTALSEISLGNIVTLITRDVQTFRWSVWMINESWISMTQIITICTLLYLKIGYVCFIGIGVILAAMPIQIYISKQVSRLKLETSKKTDERLELMKEVLSTMRVIKMYTWEAFFTKNITYARRKEISKMLLLIYFRMSVWLLGNLFGKLGFFLLIITSLWLGVNTDVTVLFYATSNFNDLKYHLGIVIPSSLAQFGDFYASFKRIFAALEAEELTPGYQDDRPTNNPVVDLDQATVEIQNRTIITNVSFNATSGLTIITGAVGSGKTSILKTILQDYPLSSGYLRTHGRIAYASQDPWLFPSSIRQNIVFGVEYDEKRYKEVVRVCALLFDFNLFENGDETIVTDRGLNLSKGQQARINLARAIYRDSDIYLLDDCLTALDGSVQEFIFNNCIKTFLKDKLCILVSQTASHIQKADNVIIMDEGSIKSISSPSDEKLQELIGENLNQVALEKKRSNQLSEGEEKNALIETEQFTQKKKIYHEVKKQGAVGYNIYKAYIIYGGGFMLFLLNIVAGGCTQFTSSFSEKTWTKWIDKKQIVLYMESHLTNTSTANFTNLEEARIVETNTLRLYGTLLVISTCMELLATFLAINFCRRASINIHKDMANKIMNSVMSFFDTHLIGNVINRFSQDTLNVDGSLPWVLNELYSVTFSMIGGISLIILVNHSFIIHVLIVFTILIILRRMYIPAGRSLKRLEASSRSPMLGHLNATLEGLTTIRSCKKQNMLIEEFDQHQDLYSSANYISVCSNRTLGFFMDSVCTSFTIFIVVRFVFFDNALTAGAIGLALTQVTGLSRTIQWLIRQWAELESLMTSVERLKEYTEIETERKEGVSLENWPTKGAITYEKVSLSYNQSDEYVLKNINFEVLPKQKIGIVGRTGAGKSSIISTIFRLYEVQGKIHIDGVNIKSIPVDVLRKSIAIIPQDPILFSGTIRTNLDPLEEFPDVIIWDALEKVGMKTSITSLHQIVNGLHFSSGQKQLICLARAIMRKNKIVIMDEATANMDPETDKILHDIIDANFVNSTILIIAHRLRSILECDKVMVLDRGEIREFDEPRKLLRNVDGLFYDMVKQSNMLDYCARKDDKDVVMKVD